MLEAAAWEFAHTTYIQPLPYRGLISLIAFNGKAEALNTALGFALPSTPRRITENATTYLWAGPNAWLVFSESPELTGELAAKAENLAAVTDQSDGHFLVRVKGPHAREILAKLVPIDLHESVFAPDAVAITLAAHIGIKIWREEDGFVVACFRSFAAALHHTLLEAANEFHLTETRG
jgi:heterotetrameric sarcosine oxidase gamma subunit